METSLLERYDRPVPRYTSYPTAPHFHSGITADTYRQWLGAVDPGTTVSLYLHIPYCDSLCWFCGCHTKITRRYEPVAAYLEVLEQEIDRVADALPDVMAVSRIHWGGGSPTILTPADIVRLAGRLDRRFRRLEGMELSVEIDPRDFDSETIEALARAGVTRASIGVQDVNPAVQRAVNRLQPIEGTRDAIAGLRAAGIAQINLDLMYGLPKQTEAEIAATVDAALALQPDRISLFGYAHVPWMKRHQRLIDETAMPDASARFAQAELAARMLVAAGYVRIGLDHFARPGDALAEALRAGRLRRNFQGYTDDEADCLIGFGASAIGCLPQGYVQNVVAIHAYRDVIRSGDLAVARGRALTAEDRVRRAVIERLMCDLRVDLGAVAEAAGAGETGFAEELKALEPLAGDGIVTIEGEGVVTVPEPARPLLRTVAAVFDRYLGGGHARHSRPV
ncbi:MAG: oxygen-independent coproporphyrinogen III oxidase [Rhodospirillaceae bacterium]|nr:oxygen-independent coproporphyrinogen III oxidase [Rhodospirillaceae bacterium]